MLGAVFEEQGDHLRCDTVILPTNAGKLASSRGAAAYAASPRPEVPLPVAGDINGWLDSPVIGAIASVRSHVGGAGRLIQGDRARLKWRHGEHGLRARRKAVP